MKSNAPLNGCDYLLLSFDRELRRHGYAGNSCQIVLELASAIAPGELERRLAALVSRYPILTAHPGGWLLPKWKPSRGGVAAPVRVHRDQPGLRERLDNEPLAVARGELLRFDLIERADGRMDVVFRWAHMLMDAISAEHFLAVVGRDDVPRPSENPSPVPRPQRSFGERVKLARKSVAQLDEFCKAPPRTVGVRFPNAAALQHYRVEKFTAEETARIRANGARLCGPLGDAQFHAAVAIVELHRLHQRVGCASPSYVLPVPVGLRPKGTVEPLFCNQVTMFMMQFLPAQLDNTAAAVAVLKSQMAQALRDGLIESSVLLCELSRYLPMLVYLPTIKHGLRGEICSLFLGDTAAVTPLLTSFCGAEIQDFAHVAAATPSPGIGVIFYYFRSLLRVTVFHLEPHFSAVEAAGFSAGVRARLLNP
jgi:hypothetical protein